MGSRKSGIRTEMRSEERGEEADSEGTSKASVASIFNFDMRDVPPDTGGTGGCPG
jgi:hypothetical protein